MKKIAAALLAASLLILPAHAAGAGPVDAAAAVLMEKETGTILFEQNAHDKLEPASVTKIMTLLLVMEAVDSGRLAAEDLVTVSARAASMGGSQVYLKENEQMTVHDLLKAVAVASGNDASVALAEHLAGSEDAFVAQMNQRAAELGMADTCFLNCTGLPAPGHLTSAHDIALMSRELILNHPRIRDYTTIWMDSLRDGQFQLANTNKLIRFYSGANGMKTGYTTEAKYCLSGTACRDGMTLIAVVLGGESSDERFATAKQMLDYGFANYRIVTPEKLDIEPIRVERGISDFSELEYDSFSLLLEKGKEAKIEQRITLEPSLQAPVAKGDVAGYVEFYVDGELQTKVPVRVTEDNGEIGFSDIFSRVLKKLLAFA